MIDEQKIGTTKQSYILDKYYCCFVSFCFFYCSISSTKKVSKPIFIKSRCFSINSHKYFFYWVLVIQAEEIIFKSISDILLLISGTYYPPRSKKIANLISRLKKDRFIKAKRNQVSNKNWTFYKKSQELFLCWKKFSSSC